MGGGIVCAAGDSWMATGCRLVWAMDARQGCHDEEGLLEPGTVGGRELG